MQRPKRRQRTHAAICSLNVVESRQQAAMIILALLLQMSALPSCASSTANHNNNKLEGQLVVSPCVARHKSAHLVTISHLQLLCASPGAYYHEQGSYSRSTTCTFTDRAKVYVLLTISSAFSGSGILLTLDAGLYNVLQPVMELVNFCHTGTWSSVSSTKHYNATEQSQQQQQKQHVCPSPGTYNVSLSFKIPAMANDQDLRYTPDIRLKFYSADNSSVKLGCYQTGTHTTINRATTHSEEGMMALALATIAFLFCFASLLYMGYRRKKRQEQMILMAAASQSQSHSAQSPPPSQHPYLRTNSSGHVLPISSDS